MSLINRILAGDKQAMLELYKTFAPKIERYLFQKLPSKEDVEEILNDTFLEAIDSLQLLKKEENLQAWLYRIAHNKTVDFYRKRKIKQVLLSQAPFLEILAKEIHQPEFQFEKNIIRDNIEKALHEISAPYREILQLHYEEHIPVKELAVKYNLSFKATESLLFRARKSFQKAYEKKE